MSTIKATCATSYAVKKTLKLVPTKRLLELLASKLRHVRSRGSSHPRREGVDDLLLLDHREPAEWSVDDDVSRHRELHVLREQGVNSDLGEVEARCGPLPLTEVVAHGQLHGPIVLQEHPSRGALNARERLRHGVDGDGLRFGEDGKTPDLWREKVFSPRLELPSLVGTRVKCTYRSRLGPLVMLRAPRMDHCLAVKPEVSKPNPYGVARLRCLVVIRRWSVTILAWRHLSWSK